MLELLLRWHLSFVLLEQLLCDRRWLSRATSNALHLAEVVRIESLYVQATVILIVVDLDVLAFDTNVAPSRQTFQVEQFSDQSLFLLQVLTLRLLDVTLVDKLFVALLHLVEKFSGGAPLILVEQLQILPSADELLVVISVVYRVGLVGGQASLVGPVSIFGE